MKRFRTIHYPVIVVVIIVPVVSIVGAWWSILHQPHAPSPDAPAPKPYDEAAAIKDAQTITRDMIGYRETAGFAVPFREPRALAVDSQDRIYVGDDRGVAIFSPDGRKVSEIALKGEPRCLAVGDPQHAKPGQLYIGMEEHVEVFDPKGEHVGVWSPPANEAYFTSITTTDAEVWVADRGNRLVWRYDLNGKLLTPVGKSAKARGEAEFAVTDRYFDLAAGHDDLVYIVNPRLLRVEGYDARRGDRETVWGKGSPAVADFFGCCNPAHLAVLPDGDFVTAEKGIPRVKIYSHQGQFKTVVVGPPQLTETPAGVAGDRRGRVLVLDAKAAKVRVFENEKKANGQAGPQSLEKKS